MPETWVAFSLLQIVAGAYLMTCIFLAPTIQKIETTLEILLSSQKPISYCVFFQNLLMSKCIWHQIKLIIRSTQGLRKMSMWIFSESAKTIRKMTNLSQQLQRWLVISLDAFLLFVQVCRIINIWSNLNILPGSLSSTTYQGKSLESRGRIRNYDWESESVVTIRN